MANIYQAFKNLLPDTPLLVGQVVTVQAGQCLVKLPSGGQIAARGQATVGQRVFVRDGFIEGVAPNLPMQIIEV